MAFTFRTDFSFGTSRTGLTDLRAQPLTSAGVATGAVLTVTFSEVGRGMYTFSGSVPDDAVFVKAYSLADAANVLDVRAAVNLTHVLGVLATGTTLVTAAENAAAVVSALSGQAVTITSPVDVDDDNRLSLVAGDDYSSGSGRIPSWTITDYAGPALAAAGKLRLMTRASYEKHGTDSAAEVEIATTVSTVSTTVTITAPLLTAAETILLSTYPPLDEDSHQYQLIGVTSSGSKDVTLVLAVATVRRRVGPEA